MWLRGEIFPLGVKMTKMGKNGTISDDSFHLMRSQNEGNHMITECVWNKFQFEHNFLTQYQNRDTKILDPTIFLIFCGVKYQYLYRELSLKIGNAEQNQMKAKVMYASISGIFIKKSENCRNTLKGGLNKSFRLYRCWWRFMLVTSFWCNPLTMSVSNFLHWKY